MRKSLILILVFTLLGCMQSKDSLTESVETYFERENVHFDCQHATMLVIPVNGCPGCVADGIKFVMENKDRFSREQNKNTVVFTGIVSKKLLYRRLDKIDFNRMSVVIDTTEKYLVDFEACDYPLVLRLKSGRIVKAENQYSNPNFYEELRNNL